ncbi:hypothetical protein F5141DRAFT_1252825 [Pisolithus sp. B1]|nr:hypothetical protein F5141DRAFT_1252825 [Pisolithus sp. B1]
MTLFVLTNGDTASRIDSQPGGLLWTWSSPDQSFAKSKTAYTLYVTNLSIANGLIISGDAHPRTEGLGPDTTRLNYMCIQDIGLAGAGQFIAFTQGGSAHVMSYDGESLRLMWEFTDVPHRSEQAPCEPRSESCFAVRLGEDNKPCIGSVYWSHANRWSHEEAFSTIRIAAFVPLPPPSASSDPSMGLTWGRKVSFSIYACTPWALAPTTIDPHAVLMHLPPSTAISSGSDKSLLQRLQRRCLFGLGWASDPLGGRVFPVKMYVLPEKVGRAADDGGREGAMNQMVVVVVQRRVHNSLVDTVEFEVDLLTGDDVQPLEDSESDTSRSRQGTVTMLDDFLQMCGMAPLLVQVARQLTLQRSSSSSFLRDLSMALVTSCLVGFSVQWFETFLTLLSVLSMPPNSFYAHRVWIIGSRNMLLTGAVLAAALPLGLVCASHSFRIDCPISALNYQALLAAACLTGNIATLFSSQYALINALGSAICDMIITTSVFFYFRHSQARLLWRANYMCKLNLVFVQMGLITSTFKIN